MVFNSWNFAVFFTAVILVYYACPRRFGWIALLAASCVFYMAWNPQLIILLVFVVLVNFVCAVSMTGSLAKFRKLPLAVALAASFGTLAVFKYSGFFLSGAGHILGISRDFSTLNIILPMGISFYTFQSAGYTIDVYRKNAKPQRNFFKLLLFITFFPQLVAGPIERTENLMPQLFYRKRFSLGNIIQGGQYIILGLFKKVAVADRIAAIVNAVYKAPGNFGGLALIIAAVLFSFQIYCDFSGYSDIAIGCAKCLGIELTQNFRQPFLSKNIKEFWRRWHISLSSWFKDYVYFPLGGSRVSKPRHVFNTIVTFLLSGLWHGANGMFIAWGLFHGVCQALGSFLPKIKRRFWLFGVFRALVTFAFVTFAFILFRAETFDDALTVISRLFVGVGEWTNPEYVFKVLNGFGVSLAEFLAGAICVLILIVTDIIGGETSFCQKLSKTFGVAQFLAYTSLAVITLAVGVFYNAGNFIYFQF
jgi:D-alanyl-lipoteichoic acid acyltransferase DltB (MBOAT superfamily)